MSETMMETTVAGTSVVPSFEMPGHVLRHALAGVLVAPTAFAGWIQNLAG